MIPLSPWHPVAIVIRALVIATAPPSERRHKKRRQAWERADKDPRIDPIRAQQGSANSRPLNRLKIVH
jgi:hypothetical protein